MYSRRLYAKIVGSVVLIVLLSLIGSWLLITQLSFTLSFVCLFLILIPHRLEKDGQFIIKVSCRPDYKQSYQQDKKQAHKG